MKDLERMKELIIKLTEANKAYYEESREIMSNLEYDRLYDELADLEKKTGIYYAGSPTQKVGSDIVSELPKEKHEKEMLSLDKTKDVARLSDWLGNHAGVMSWKLDGLTVVLTYNKGNLIKAVTRGNGEIGDIITNNAKQCKSVPLTIPYQGELVVRGEAVISYSDFDKINERLAENERYKNPRNLASGSIRQLDSGITAKRKVQIILFRMITEIPELDTMTKQFDWLEKQGFTVVEHYPVKKENVDQVVKFFERKIDTHDIPSDGLVIAYDDTKYGNSLGNTEKFSRHSFAFKWKDELAETILREVEWNTSRTGSINPVAVFDPVELEGTTVSRASIHNVSIVKELKLGIGDKITVYKSNMIIPQIDENITKSNSLTIPDTCPICGAKTAVKSSNKTEILYCTNEYCPEKLIAKFAHFCSRDALNIKGLSEATIELLIKRGWIKSYCDFFTLYSHKKEWSSIPGYGIKSVSKYLDSIEESRTTTPERLLYSLGIPKIGRTQSKEIFRKFNTWNDFIEALTSRYNFAKMEGFGDILNDNIYSWYEHAYKEERIPELIEFLTMPEKEVSINPSSEILSGKTFVITGSVLIYRNRNALKEKIESLGGKVSSSISSKTDYLINNDVTSTSSKNAKAKTLGIPIINEEEFQDLIK